MARKVAIDSGPLVALFDRDDQFHRRAVEFLQPFHGELITTLAVITEVVYLLDFSVAAQTDFLSWVAQGGLTPVEVSADDLRRVGELLEKYADRPMDFADATVVAVCERLGVREVASVDADFGIYRLHGKKVFRNVFLAG